MKKQKTDKGIFRNSKLYINMIWASSLVIMFLGIFFSIFSYINKIEFNVLNNSVSGIVFGVMVLYLGIKYYFSIESLKEDVAKNHLNFSLRNLKKKKTV